MSEAVPKLNFPLIPPKKTSNDPPSLSVDKEDTVPTWYIVQSPREIKGTAGPFSVEELRNLYQIGDLTDNTLVWKDGLEKWELLKDLTTLRHRMVYIPIVPPRLGSTFEDALINPIMNPPPSHVASNFERIHECRVDNVCSRCGSFASTHIYDSENKLPAFGFIRSEVGSCREASEVIPGFLFIGNSSSSKSS